MTLFLSAFALFLVQPIIGKLILPKLGGTPQVWNTCMVFFQMVLLAGYAYTHTASTKFNLRKQLLVHCILLVLPLIVLLAGGQPFDIREKWTPPYGTNPIPATLLLLITVVGLPFFVVSTTAPLLQRWFAYTGHPAAKDPYFLYGASNLGSLLALVLYPVLIEPYFVLTTQAWMWTVVYGLFLITVMLCALMVWAPSGQLEHAGIGPGGKLSEGPPPSTPPPVETAASSTAVASGPPPASTKPAGIKKFGKQVGKIPHKAGDISILRDDPVTPARRLRWILWAAVPSSLMLGVTSHITVDLSPIPLFWVVPLGLYLLSFILVFSKWPVVWTEEPHNYVLYLQPAAIALSILAPMSRAGLFFSIFLNVTAFFLTALMCHGELAKDRPSARHLTEFYLMMSVGGMVGGIFNGLIAPVVFPGLWEFPIALVMACLVRPVLKEGGWLDDILGGMSEKTESSTPKAKGVKSIENVATTTGTNVHVILDYLLPVGLLIFSAIVVFTLTSALGLYASVFIGFGVPLIVACFFYGRPIRLGLAIGAVLLVRDFYESRGGHTLSRSRSYFGITVVHEQQGKGDPAPYATMMHGTTNHGMNYRKPESEKDWANPEKDFSRLSTTYYHRYGPAGVVMEQFNWFPGPQNTFWSDNRLPAAMVGQGSVGIGLGLPVGALVNSWSEPPYATIGLGTGTMASYCRPYQTCDYYEIDNHVRKLSLPERGEPIFYYLRDAERRGGIVHVYMGDAFQRMKQPYINPALDKDNKGGGPNNFYKMMVVDAFSSDAIPVHLLTKEAFKVYFEKLAEDGILCVHTSNRHVDLTKVVADVASDMGFYYKKANDQAPEKSLGHFISTWVMVSRKSEYMKNVDSDPFDYTGRMRTANMATKGYWRTYPSTGRHIWTLDHSNLLGVMGHSRDEE
jgi:hypothetical protein